MVLDALWERPGIGPAMRRLLAGRRLDASAERVLFALVANRALAPSSKLAAARWASQDVFISRLAATTDDACYRAMDWLLEISGALEKEIFGRVSDLPGLEVDLLFFDTTSSTCFQTEEADEPVARGRHGRPAASKDADGAEAGDAGEAGAPFRAFGKSKDHRDDLPQVVIGMAVTRDGIPVRHSGRSAWLTGPQLDLLAAVLPAMLAHRALIAGKPVDAVCLRAVVEQVLLPLAVAPQAAAATLASQPAGLEPKDRPLCQ